MWLALIGPVAITAQAFISYLNALPGIPFQAPMVAGAIVVTIIFFVLNWVGIKTVGTGSVLFIAIFC
jgi:APA family basic amino acid/polyamine antiporter